jgi:hypothetical protein
MRAFMDEVTYFQPGNAVKLLKRRPSAAPVSAEATL